MENIHETQGDLRVEILEQLYDLFRYSLSGEFDKMREMHWGGPEFTKIGAKDTVGISNFEEAMRVDEYAFDRISDAQFYIDNLHLVSVDSVVIAVFLLKVRGKFAPLLQEVETQRRATIVFVETPEGRKILHKHFSGMPMSF